MEEKKKKNGSGGPFFSLQLYFLRFPFVAAALFFFVLGKKVINGDTLTSAIRIQRAATSAQRLRRSMRQTNLAFELHLLVKICIKNRPAFPCGYMHHIGLTTTFYDRNVEKKNL